MNQVSHKQQDDNFVPKGAMAFFGVVLLIMASVWLFVYFIMIKQA
jgi:uncharacterized membrane protein